MISPARDESCSGVLTPEMLAGLSVRVEAEEDLTVRPCQPPQPPAGPAANDTEQPTSDQLAGVYLHVEAPEDLTVHPRAAAPNSSDT
jgi:hypothetical protein